MRVEILDLDTLKTQWTTEHQSLDWWGVTGNSDRQRGLLLNIPGVDDHRQRFILVDYTLDSTEKIQIPNKIIQLQLLNLGYHKSVHDFVDKYQQLKYATTPDIPQPEVKVGDHVTVVNNDFFDGESVEVNCPVVAVLNPTTLKVKLKSDPSLQCLVEYNYGRWEIVADC
jgi:hypothetical protein